MYKYLVHVMRPNLVQWNVTVVDERGRGVRITTAQQRRGTHIPEGLDIAREDMGDYVKLETWYMDSEKDANALARTFALESPGSQVVVAKVETYLQAPKPTTVNTVKVTEKGVVPA